MPIASNAQYRAIFDSAVEAIAVFDADGVIHSANPAADRLFGYEPGTIVGCGITMLLPEPAPSGLGAHVDSYGLAGLRGIVGTVREVAGRRKNGTVIPIDLSIAEWECEGNTCFTGVMRDISRRKEAEAALASNEAHLANLYAQTAAGLAETDRAGHFLSVNDRYCEIVGRSREALLKLRLQDIVHPEDQQPNQPLYSRLTAAGAPLLIDERYLRGDGSTVWVTKTASPIGNEGSEPIALLVAIDVTERKLAEQALKESEERLRALQNEFAHLARVNDLGEMAAAIAHEINQPLTAIANYLHSGQMFVDGRPAANALADAREAMANAAEQGSRAGTIVRSLRDFARKSVGSRSIERADNLVDTAMALALLDAAVKGISVEHQAGAGEAMVEVDAVQIEQVLVNLFRNSIEAMSMNPKRTPRRLTIATKTLLPEHVVQFCVADTGPGIAPDLRDRLFDPFVTSKPKGMGMGLSVCRRIIESHGGNVELASNSTSGATFKVTLPISNVIP
ncbi:MAG: PAS domain S-box protein [Devosia sp.]